MEFVRFLKMKENKYVCVINKITYHISYYGINPDDATEKEHFVCVFIVCVFMAFTSTWRNNVS